MKSRTISGITLLFDPSELDAADLIGSACTKSIQLIHEYWELETPEDCRVYVMTSWLHFVFHSAPWPWQILLAISIPLWYFRVSKLWNYAGGWAQRYGQRRAVGVKPPRLLQLADRSIGHRVFIKEDNISEKVQHVTCHELVHAFTAHLKLPMWLNEGLAMVTVDNLLGKPTVRADTLELLTQPASLASPGGYQSLTLKDKEAVVYHVVRGYWITRYLEETQPELLKSILKRRYTHRALESKIAAAVGMSRDEFWSGIDGVVSSHFFGDGSCRKRK